MVLGALLLALAGGAAAQPCPSTPGDGFSFLAVDGNPFNKCPLLPIVRWDVPRVVYECDFFLDSDKQIACGGTPQTCAALCEAAAADWNTRLTGHFTLAPAAATTPVVFCDPGDGRTSLSGGTIDCAGDAFGSNVLAVALRVNFVSGPMVGAMVDSNITVNQAFSFTQARFQATLAHEFGHVIGLDHPNQCAKDFNVLMRSASLFDSTDPCFVGAPTPDDVNGALVIYPDTQSVCGDANADGDINDVDAVQVLRAAALLPSSCSLAVCDVTGDGMIDDVDGVNVLRAAASLPFTDNCS